MFKLAIYLRNDGTTINPFACPVLCSYMRNGIIVMTDRMFKMMDGMNAKSRFDVPTSELVVIGDEDIEYIKVVKNISQCIKYLSQTHASKGWWFIGDNETANQMIWNGVIMDVHLSKSYAHKGMKEWMFTYLNALPQGTLFDKTLLEQPNMRFSLLSNTRDAKSETKSIRHYYRRNQEESTLLYAMKDIIDNGFKRPNRTGVDTITIFGRQFEYRMNERVDPNTGESSFRLPLLTTKRMFTRGVFQELKWFLSGGTDSKTLEEQKINIWKGNTTREYLDSIGHEDYDEGETGPIYGFQWKHWGAEYEQGKHDYTGEGIDQISQVVDSLQTDPYSRRHIISGWNVSDLKKMCLPPCHVLYQFMVHEEDDQKYLSLMMTQRSCDTFLGLPFNICSLGMFLTIMAHKVGMKPYKIVHSIADMHIYESHIDAVSTQLQREPFEFPYIRVACDPKEKIEDYNYDDIVIEGYYCHEPIKADMVA